MSVASWRLPDWSGSHNMLENVSLKNGVDKEKKVLENDMEKVMVCFF